METPNDPTKLMFIICSFITLFSFITFLPDSEDNQYHHQFDFFSDHDENQQQEQEQHQYQYQQQQQQQSEPQYKNQQQSEPQYVYKIKEQPLSYFQLFKNIFSLRKRGNNNKTSNSNSKSNKFNSEDFYSNGILKSNDFKNDHLNNSNNSSDNSFDSFGYQTEGDLDYSKDIPQEFFVAENNDLKEQLEQAILNTNAERRGRLLAEQEMIREQEKIQEMKSDLLKQEAMCSKLLELCTASIHKKKKAEETIDQLSNQMSCLIDIISAQTNLDMGAEEYDSLDGLSPSSSSSFYTNGNSKTSSTNNNQNNNSYSDKITLTIDRDFIEKFESVSKTLQELEMKKSGGSSGEESSSISSSTSSSRSENYNGGDKSTNLDLETLFFDLVQLSKKQLPFTLNDVVSPSI
ncbi:hypothetical protein CYY_009907 [Polysphondylium violaceum]|uniref:Uncharacterized protein n=1 Tax=Polysphondylium violaceum TaxID=133409 RepID=A0A8J4PJP6_9MYCE|nr:hypothetical protein CYY_009907 [Polysphondylium violaceum]